MSNAFTTGLCLAGALLAPASVGAATAYANEVLSFSQGPGTTHPNFVSPSAALGAPDYDDSLSPGFGVGSVALGVAGSITLQMSSPFSVGGTSAADLVVYEIGPSQGGTAEQSQVFISANGATWFNVGTASGGTAGIDLDNQGFAASTLFRYVRLVDLSGNAGQPAGADIDAVAVLTAVPEPATSMLAGAGAAVLLLLRRRFAAAAR